MFNCIILKKDMFNHLLIRLIYIISLYDIKRMTGQFILFFFIFLLSVALGLTQFCKLRLEEIARNIAGKKETLNGSSCLLDNKLFS